ncbi:hypothetical protein [Sporosarcina sp. E16_8]|uniref:hypothetical protein n=1 Tax=Sporosarcina sp. E16_8 TaxID=2789295 RepID=UPI001A90EA9B|nr:hypothetical protein [Sporosarcina sp. E16_8]MBO0589061.1 hypothetical protein [Sporosarcina sp. E16_8]
MRFFSKKKVIEMENYDPIANVEALMKDLGVPSWLQTDFVAVLKVRQKTMSNEEIRNWLEQLAMSVNYILPEEFQVEKNLDLCFTTHKEWVESEINEYAKLIYEDVDTTLKNLPASIQKMNRKAQKAYLAVSVCLLNIFSQLD